MTAAVTINAHGVIEPHEVLSLSRGRPGWRGCALAEIRLSRLPDGWRAQGSFQYVSGDCHGSGGPITLRDVALPSRGAAIDRAVLRLREVAERRGDAEAARVLAWLATLRPAQPDLFAQALAA